MSELAPFMRAHWTALATEFQLTPAQANVLRRLEPGKPLPMSSLADHLVCDASNITGIVDRLEARGLVERRACAHDRRVKELALTRTGAALRARMVERLGQPPEPIARLSSAEQQALCAILRKALGKS